MLKTLRSQFKWLLPVAAIALAAIYTAAVYMHAVAVAQCRYAVEWGTVPAWISAIGSFLALAGVGIAYLAWRSGEDRRRDEEINQARLVRGVLDPKSGFLHLYNDSREPVYGVNTASITLIAMDQPTDHQYTPLIRMSGTDTKSRVEPGGRVALLRFSGSVTRPDGKPIDGVRSARVEFTDANGRRWARIDDFEPIRIIGSASTKTPEYLLKAHPHPR